MGLYLCMCYYLVTSFIGTSTIKLRNRSADIGLNVEAIENDRNGMTYIQENYDMFKNCQYLYVIPGGGSSYVFSSCFNDVVPNSQNIKDGGYPSWTRERVIEAYRHYERHAHRQNQSLFLTLSAGSLNAPNNHFGDGRIIFECQHMMKHLSELNIPSERVYGDMFSWDTVTNGLSLRLFVEGLLANKLVLNKQKKPKIELLVFISDFHANRVNASFHWVLGLNPSLLPKINIIIHSINSTASMVWKSASDYNSRIEHEKKGTNLIYENAKKIKTFSQFSSYIMLGGHHGLNNYLHDTYKKSVGGGW
eukprot:gene4459-6306_t